MTVRKTKIRVEAAICEDNTVIVESLFRETTRNGRHTIRLVHLAITPNILIITSTRSFGYSTPKSNRDNQNILEMRTLHSLDTVSLTIFKKSQRQTLKIDIYDHSRKYFELEKSCGSDNLWEKWCKCILQLGQQNTRRKKSHGRPLTKSTSYDLSIVNAQWESRKFYWNDKYLYLGSKREIEDNSRPMPMSGLGPAEDMKLFYLKPQYFGCWDQSEHWVQCESSKLLK